MRPLFCFLVAAALCGPAVAADVTFSGTVANTCTLAVPVSGTLALSADGTTLGSEETGGIPAELTIISLGVNTITIGAPTRTDQPVGYVATGEQVGVAYYGLSGLSSVSHPTYTSSSSTFSAGLLPLTTLVIHNRIVNANGFVQGTYKTKTVVTCS